MGLCMLFHPQSMRWVLLLRPRKGWYRRWIAYSGPAAEEDTLCQTAARDRRNGTTTLPAALSVADGGSSVPMPAPRTSGGYEGFLRQIDRPDPKRQDAAPDADNYATHEHPNVLGVVERSTRTISHALHADPRRRGSNIWWSGSSRIITTEAAASWLCLPAMPELGRKRFGEHIARHSTNPKPIHLDSSASRHSAEGPSRNDRFKLQARMQHYTSSLRRFGFQPGWLAGAVASVWMPGNFSWPEVVCRWFSG